MLVDVLLHVCSENNYFRRDATIKSEEIIMFNVLYSECVKCVPSLLGFVKPFVFGQAFFL